jgi:hypothetical protein
MRSDGANSAKAAYQDFLTLWKDADSDIPILKQAKAEYAKLHHEQIGSGGAQQFWFNRSGLGCISMSTRVVKTEIPIHACIRQ